MTDRERGRLSRPLAALAYLARTSVLLIGMIGAPFVANSMDTAAALKPFVEDYLRNSFGEGSSVSIGDILIDEDSSAERQVIRVTDVSFEDADGVWSVAIDSVEVEIDILSFLRNDSKPGSVSLSGLHAVRQAASSGSQTEEDSTRKQTADSALSAVASGIFAATDWAASLGLGRVIVTNASLRSEGTDSAAGLSGGWLIMTGGNDGQALLAGFSLLAEGDYVGRVRMTLLRDGTEETVQISGDLDNFDFPRFGRLLDLPQSDITADLQFGGAFEAEFGADRDLEFLRTSWYAGPGRIYSEAGAEGFRVNSASATFDYRPDSGRIDIAEFRIDSELAGGFASGHAYLVEDRDGSTALEGRVDLSNVILKGDLNAGAPEFGIAASALFKARLDPFEVRLARAVLRVGSDIVGLEGQLVVSDAGWHGTARLKADRLNQKSFFVLWPAGMLQEPRGWLNENVTGSVLEDFNAELGFSSETGPSVRLHSRFRDAVIRYVRRLPPAIRVGGFLSLDDGVVGVRFEQALLSVAGEGPVNLAGSDLTIPKISDGSVPATTRLRFSGDLSTVLALLDHKPYHLMVKAGLVQHEVEGQATGSATVSIPLTSSLDWSAVRFAVQGEVANVTTTTRSGSVELASSHLQVTADNQEAVVSGTGTINGVSGSGRWRIGFGAEEDKSSLLVGKINLSSRLLRTFRISVPDGLLGDSRNADYYVSFMPGSPAQFGVTADAGETGLGLPFIGQGTDSWGTAKILVEGRLADNPEITRILIDGDGIRADGRLVSDPIGRGSLLEFSSFTMGDWFESAVLIGNTPEGKTRIDLVGGVMDLRKAPDGSFSTDAAGGTGQVINVNLDRVDFNSKLHLTDLQGTLDLSHRLEGSMTGRVNGGELMGVRVATSSNGLAAYFATNNAGAAMSDAGVTDGLEGGALELSLIPNPRTGAYDGQVTILNSTVKNLPALTRLLNIVTIVGLLDQLVSQGISFTEVEAEFSFSEDMLQLKRGTAIGPSLGVRMNGEWNMARETVDLAGTITPFSPLSELARSTPLQIFGFKKGAGLGAISFAVRGKEQNLDVHANPLSAIAPGFLREPFDY